VGEPVEVAGDHSKLSGCLDVLDDVFGGADRHLDITPQ